MDKVAALIDAAIEKRAQELAVNMLQELQKSAASKDQYRTVMKILLPIGIALGLVNSYDTMGNIMDMAGNVRNLDTSGLTELGRNVGLHEFQGSTGKADALNLFNRGE